LRLSEWGLDDGGPVWRRAVHVISTPNISLFDRNATPEAEIGGDDESAHGSPWNKLNQVISMT
jgi:hypothetical protein